MTIKLVIHCLTLLGWVDTHFGQEKVEEDCVELAKEVEEDSDDSDALDMEDFDPDQGWAMGLKSHGI